MVHRHVYQRSGGGKTYCPVEREGRIIITSTPLFAKQVSSKLAYGSAREVQRDLRENHNRPVAVSYIQHVSEAVASIIEAQEESWNYGPPKLDCGDKLRADGTPNLHNVRKPLPTQKEITDKVNSCCYPDLYLQCEELIHKQRLNSINRC